MERSRKILHKIVSASHRVVTAANVYADYKDLFNVERAHFQLEEEMQNISVACEWLAGILPIMSPLPRGPPFEKLKDWLMSDEPRVCCETLNQMEMLLWGDGSLWLNGMGLTGMTATKDNLKIDEAVNLFDSRKRSFHLLFTTDIWGVQQQKDLSHSLLHNIHYPSTPYITTPSSPPMSSVYGTPVTQPRSEPPDSYYPAPSAPPIPYNNTPFIPPLPSPEPVTQPRSDPPGSYYPPPSALPIPNNMTPIIPPLPSLEPVTQIRPDPPDSAPSAPTVSPEIPHAGYGGVSGPPAIGFQVSPWAIPPPNQPPPPVPYTASVYNTFNQPLPGAMWPPAVPPPTGPFMPAAVAWPMPPGASSHPAHHGYPTWQPPTQQPTPMKFTGHPTGPRHTRA